MLKAAALNWRQRRHGSSAPLRLAATVSILLVALLLTAASHQATTPPDLSGAAAALNWNSGSGDLSWYYTHPGDYNQDGLVTVSDITPLGQNFDAEGPFPMDSALSVIDGNGDGFITVSDITPIGQNFNKSLERYEAYHANSAADYPEGNVGPNGPGATLLGSIALIDNALTAGQRRHFVLALGASAPTEGRGWVRPLDTAQNPGTPSNMIEFTNGGGPGNTAPVASLVLSASDVPPNSEITLDASGSTDDDGDDLTYSFDPEGDGTFMTPSAQDTLNWTYFALGDLSPAVRVNDGSGGEDDAAAALTISLGTLEKHIIDAQCQPQQAGGNVALVMCVDRPGVLFNDESAEFGYTVRWRYALSPLVDSWSDQRAVAKGYLHLSGAVADGRAAVAFANGDDILFRRCKNMDGSGDWYDQLMVADNSEVCDTVLFLPSLAIISGSPAVVCISGDALFGGDLIYNRALYSAGTSWGAATVLIPAETEPIGTAALQDVYSRPAIAYVTIGAFNGELMYWRADDEEGDSWTAAPVEVRPEANYAISDTSLQMVRNRPAIVYYNSDTNRLGYVRSLDSYGVVWGDPVILDSDTNANANIDLAVINGLPTIAYHKAEVGLCCAVALDDKGESWNDPVVVEPGSAGVSVKLAEVDGHIAFAYHNTAQKTIEFAVYR